MKLVFDHCYRAIGSESEYFCLGERGFAVSDFFVEHPGSQFCRFLNFARKDTIFPNPAFQYLEFVHVKATAENPSDKTNQQIPGFSLRCSENLSALFEESKTTLTGNQPSYLHKNYDWKTDDVSKLPGWNFLSLEKPIVESIYIWWTEYEPDPTRTPMKRDVNHKNSVNGFVGFLWDVEFKTLNGFSALNRCQSANQNLVLNDGTEIITRESSAWPTQYSAKKTHAFSAVVLTCTDWNLFLKESKPDSVFDWNGKQAGVISMSDVGWDLIVVES